MVIKNTIMTSLCCKYRFLLEVSNLGVVSQSCFADNIRSDGGEGVTMDNPQAAPNVQISLLTQ